MNNIKKITILALFVLIFAPLFVFAQGTTLPAPTGPGTNAENPLVTCGVGDRQPCNVEDAKNLIQNIIKLVFMFAGFVVAVMFMYAGFLLITAAGDMGQIQKARNIFKRVVVGFLIMYLSYILVKNVLTRIGAVEFFTDLIK